MHGRGGFSGGWSAEVRQKQANRNVGPATLPSAKGEDVTGWSAQMYTTFAGMNHPRPGWKTTETERMNQSTQDFLSVLWGLKERRKAEVNRLP
jgi:hypothetical protein